VYGVIAARAATESFAAATGGMQAGRKPTEHRSDRLQIISMTMKDGEELIVGRRLRDILNHASRLKA
jgi:hypothetical protein